MSKANGVCAPTVSRGRRPVLIDQMRGVNKRGNWNCHSRIPTDEDGKALPIERSSDDDPRPLDVIYR